MGMSLTPETGGAAVKGTCATGFRFVPERRHLKESPGVDWKPQGVTWSALGTAEEFPPISQPHHLQRDVISPPALSAAGRRVLADLIINTSKFNVHELEPGSRAPHPLLSANRRVH
jgi:hypothetical protein